MADKPMPDNEEGWRKQLTPEQYRVLREKGTEPPFTGEYLHAEADGTFTCAACSNKLQFDSGTGWPSFDEALPGAVEHHTDSSHGMVRTEITCARCGSHPRAASATASIRSASSSTRRTEPQDSDPGVPLVAKVLPEAAAASAHCREARHHLDAHYVLRVLVAELAFNAQA